MDVRSPPLMGGGFVCVDAVPRGGCSLPVGRVRESQIHALLLFSFSSTVPALVLSIVVRRQRNRNDVERRCAAHFITT